MRILVLLVLLLGQVGFAQLIKPIQEQAVLVNVSAAGLTLNGQPLVEGAIFDGSAQVKTTGRAEILCIDKNRETTLVTINNETRVACDENYASSGFSLRGTVPSRAAGNECANVALIDPPETSQQTTIVFQAPTLRWDNPNQIEVRVAIRTEAGAEVLNEKMTTNQVKPGILKVRTNYVMTLLWKNNGASCSKSSKFRLATHEEALKSLEFARSIKDLPQPIRVSVLSGYYVSTGFYGAALDLLTKNQNRDFLVLALGELYDLIGLNTQAQKIYRSVLGQAQFNNPLLAARAALSLGNVLTEQGIQLNEAQEALVLALKTLEAFKLDLLADARASLGWCLYSRAKSDPAQATILFKQSSALLVQAIEQASKQKRQISVPPIWNWRLGRTYEAQNLKPEALKAYQTALKAFQALGDMVSVRLISIDIQRVQSP
jgi:tetratricopeptide (TPR) repeat protein